jgi:orotate phosphoribosyltransferase
VVLVLDDLITSGRTLRLSFEAINRSGAAASGFSFSGC